MVSVVSRHQSRSDTRFLERHGKQWRVVVSVPRKLQKALGKTRLKEGLGTERLVVAQFKRWSVVARLQGKIAQEASKRAAYDPVLQEALEWKECVDANNYLFLTAQPDATESAALLQQVIDGRTREVEAEFGPARARDFQGIATGTQTPLEAHVDRWLEESTYTERTKLAHRLSIKMLSEWLAEGGWPQTVEGINKLVAGYFVSERFIAKGVHSKTANTRISSLSSYWRWLSKKVLTTASVDNPWPGQWLREKAPHQRGEEAYKRAFTDDEVRLLMEGETTTLLKEFMLVAALSGAREDEIACLKVGDCTEADGVPVFAIRKSKTKAGVRKVPINSKLQALVKRRTKDKPAGAWLFDELPEQTPERGSERYMPMNKRFNRYRKDLGVHEQWEGRRQSRVDFHSFRRWFITKAEQADIPPHIIACVVGHERQGMTLGRYSAGASVAQMRKCVDAVRLPRYSAR